MLAHQEKSLSTFINANILTFWVTFKTGGIKSSYITLIITLSYFINVGLTISKLLCQVQTSYFGASNGQQYDLKSLSK